MSMSVSGGRRSKANLLMPLRPLRSSTINAAPPAAAAAPSKRLPKGAQRAAAAGAPVDDASNKLIAGVLLPAATVESSRQPAVALSAPDMDLIRLLYRKFCQQVRFGSSVQLNRGKCEVFLRKYGLMPHPKHVDDAMALLVSRPPLPPQSPRGIGSH